MKQRVAKAFAWKDGYEAGKRAMSGMVVQGVTDEERAMKQTHAAINATTDSVICALEDRVRTLESEVRTLQAWAIAGFSHWGDRVQTLEDQAMDTGVVTLRITAERGGR